MNVNCENILFEMMERIRPESGERFIVESDGARERYKKNFF